MAGSEVAGSSTRAIAMLASGLAGKPMGSDGRGFTTASALEATAKRNTMAATHFNPTPGISDHDIMHTVVFSDAPEDLQIDKLSVSTIAGEWIKYLERLHGVKNGLPV